MGKMTKMGPKKNGMRVLISFFRVFNTAFCWMDEKTWRDARKKNRPGETWKKGMSRVGSLHYIWEHTTFVRTVQCVLVCVCVCKKEMVKCFKCKRLIFSVWIFMCAILYSHIAAKCCNHFLFVWFSFYFLFFFYTFINSFNLTFMSIFTFWRCF